MIIMLVEIRMVIMMMVMVGDKDGDTIKAIVLIHRAKLVQGSDFDCYPLSLSSMIN